eukprot:260059-Chlamydomonas_euryale.AAC.1
MALCFRSVAPCFRSVTPSFPSVAPRFPSVALCASCVVWSTVWLAPGLRERAMHTFATSLCQELVSPSIHQPAFGRGSKASALRSVAHGPRSIAHVALTAKRRASRSANAAVAAERAAADDLADAGCAADADALALPAVGAEPAADADAAGAAAVYQGNRTGAWVPTLAGLVLSLPLLALHIYYINWQ